MITPALKDLDRKRKREYQKHQKSTKWSSLNNAFIVKAKKEKETYRRKIVDDLRTSQPGKWYSKLKKMAGIA